METYGLRNITIYADKIAELAQQTIDDDPELLEVYTVKDVQFAVHRGLDNAIDRLVDGFAEWAFGPDMRFHIDVNMERICDMGNCPNKVKRDKETGEYYLFCHKHQAEEDARTVEVAAIVQDCGY